MRMDNLAILIPCYNEELTITNVVCDFKEQLPDAHIYVYDNNSTDNTAMAAEAAGATVVKAPLQGKGNVVRQMFREIDANCYVMVDGDNTYDASVVKTMVSCVLVQHADMVVGDRLSSTYFTENKRLFHNTGNRLMRHTINKLFHVSFQDIMTGYRAFSYDFVKTYPVLSKGFEVETEMSIHAAEKNMYVMNVVSDYRDRPAGSVSKLNTISDGMKVLMMCFGLYRQYKPLRFYGCISAILAVLSVGFVVPVVKTYLQTGLVPSFPTLIVCGFAAIASMISLMTGIIINAMVVQNRQMFELELLSIHR